MSSTSLVEITVDTSRSSNTISTVASEAPLPLARSTNLATSKSQLKPVASPKTLRVQTPAPASPLSRSKSSAVYTPKSYGRQLAREGGTGGKQLDKIQTRRSSDRGSSSGVHRSSWGTEIPAPLSLRRSSDPETESKSKNKSAGGILQSDSLVDVSLESPVRRGKENGGDDIRMGAQTGEAATSTITAGPTTQSTSMLKPIFGVWINSMRRRSTKSRLPVRIPAAASARKAVEPGGAVSGADIFATADRSQPDLHHQTSGSFSSSAFLREVKTASISQGSFSIQSVSDRRKGWLRSGTRSSRCSEEPGLQTGSPLQRQHSQSQNYSHHHQSSSSGSNAIEKTSLQARLLDERILQRGLHRWNILAELIKTEEMYVEDLKMLINVYIGLVSSLSSMTDLTRRAIRRNLGDIIDLHESLLVELYKVIPGMALTFDMTARLQRISPARSLDHIYSTGPMQGYTNNSTRHSVDGGVRSIIKPDPSIFMQTADPALAATVAKLFESRLHAFFAYEEYGAKYERVLREVAASKSLPLWSAVEKGVESLALSIASDNDKTFQAKKGLTLGDLLIKPIQRVCRYPLIFDQLHEATPVCDGPDSQGTIDRVRYRLRETAKEINRATNDPKMRDRIEKTWLLQDRLVLRNNALESSDIRLLGHILLCGALHVAWQKRDAMIEGEFMAVFLFRSHLLFASAEKGGTHLHVVIAVLLSDVRVESANSGKGLTCYSAPFSWKVIFESEHRLFELILSACSAREEEEWKSKIIERANAESQLSIDGNPRGHDRSACVGIDIMPIGEVFGQPGTLTRRISLHRADKRSESSMVPVIINNTFSLAERQSSLSPIQAVPNINSISPGTGEIVSPPISRSQSLINMTRIPVLSPRRSDRIRLEDALADIWTRDDLPYPGMLGSHGSSSGSTRREGLVMTAAGNMMRKLSHVSMASTFTRRSSSLHSLSSMKEHSPTATTAPTNFSTMDHGNRPSSPRKRKDRKLATGGEEDDKSPSQSPTKDKNELLSAMGSAGKASLLSDTLLRRTRAAHRKRAELVIAEGLDDKADETNSNAVVEIVELDNHPPDFSKEEEDKEMQVERSLSASSLKSKHSATIPNPGPSLLQERASLNVKGDCNKDEAPEEEEERNTKPSSPKRTGASSYLQNSGFSLGRGLVRSGSTGFKFVRKGVRRVFA
jgi:hypothetical protein